MPEPDAGDLYRELAPAVLGYLRAQRVPDPEDTLGEVFLSVARDLGRFRGDAGARRRWVFTIAHHRAADAHRRASRRARLPAAPPPSPVEGPEPADTALWEALGSLSPDQRDVLALRFVADLPIDVVARITSRTEGAVKALQHRGLENLRRRLRGPATGPYPPGPPERLPG